MTRRIRVPTEIRCPGTAAAHLPARTPMIMAEYAYELRKSGLGVLRRRVQQEVRIQIDAVVPVERNQKRR